MKPTAVLAAVLAVLLTPVFAADYVIREIRVNQDPDVYCTPQNEPSVAIDPYEPERIMVVAHHPTIVGLQSLGAYYTPDGGKSWEQAVFLAENFDSNGIWLNLAADPSVASDQEGNFYIGILGRRDQVGEGSATSGWPEASGVYVARIAKKAGGKPLFSGFSLPGAENEIQPRDIKFVAVSRTDSFALADDKPLVAADGYSASAFRGNVYVAWTQFIRDQASPTKWESRLMTSVSRDGAKTFSEPKILAKSRPGFWPHAAFPAVGPAGELYIFWFAFEEELLDEVTPFTGSIWLSESSDGGKVFAPPRLIRRFTSPPRRIGPTNIKINGYPAAAVAAEDGKTIALAWTEYGSGDADVYLAVSRDGGFNWTLPLRVNDDALANRVDQFFPTVSIDATGVIWVAWIDRRVASGAYYDLYAAYVEIDSDGALRFSPNFRVTAWPSKLGNFCHSNRFIGDYIDSVAAGSTFIPVWADGRRGQLDIFIARIQKTP